MIIQREHIRIGAPLVVRPHSSRMTLDEPATRMKVVCAWCGSVRVEDDTWAKPAIEEHHADRHLISHGICNSCLQEVRPSPTKVVIRSYRQEVPLSNQVDLNAGQIVALASG